jgi:formylglycine-generating enzyme
LGSRSGGVEMIELLAGSELDSGDAPVTVPARGIACVAALGSDCPERLRRAVEEVRRRLRPGVPNSHLTATAAATAAARRPLKRSPTGSLPAGMTRLEPGLRSIRSVFKLRECGTYERAALSDQAFPDLSGEVVVVREVMVEGLALGRHPVTNRQFQQFLLSSLYRPADRHRFLEHWRAGAPPPGEEEWPVTFIALEDAREYASWAGLRLPTEDEWQVGLAEGAGHHGARRVWEWTESEHFDGHNRFVILKGGSDMVLAGSDWYAESGPKEPWRSAKFILFAPGADRCSTLGFRCAADLGKG